MGNADYQAALLTALPSRLALPMQELIAKILGEASKHRMQQILLVGAAPGVGTSMVAQHLAEHLAAVSKRALLIEIRPNTTDGYDSLDVPQGESEGGRVVSIRLSSGALQKLATGEGASLPADWLAAFDMVVWDVPPITVAPTALVLGRFVDGVILLLQAHRTRRAVAEHVALRLKEGGGRLLGVVLNRSHSFIPDWIYRLL